MKPIGGSRVSWPKLTGNGIDCGCALGARAMTAAFLITLAWLIVRYGFGTWAMFAHLPIALGAAVVFAGLGKTVGMAAARRRRAVVGAPPALQGRV